MKKTMLTLAVTVLAVLVSGFHAWAQPEAAAPKGVEMSVTGVNYCLETTVKNTLAECRVERARHVLKVTEAKDADGKVVADMKGWTLHYLYSFTSAVLSNDAKFRGKEVTITGTVYRDERVIDVKKIEMDGQDVTNQSAAPAQPVNRFRSNAQVPAQNYSGAVGSASGQNAANYSGNVGGASGQNAANYSSGSGTASGQ